MVSNRFHLATITSRPEAFVIASVLEHEGIPVFLDGVWHASVDPMSVALGGHRLYVPVQEHGKASALIREIGLQDAPIAYRGARRAIGRVLGVLMGAHVFFGVPGMIAGALPFASWLLWFFAIPLGTPVDPRGQNDYFLSDEIE